MTLEAPDRVGPVLQAGAAAEALIAAIRELNHDVTVQDRGSYLRVLVPSRCVVTRVSIERHLGAAFELPGDLEKLMPSFKGRFEVDHDQAQWRFGG